MAEPLPPAPWETATDLPPAPWETAAPKEGLGILSLPSDIAEAGARGIDWAAQKVGATPRKPQPFSFQREDAANPEYSGIIPAVKQAAEAAKLPGKVYVGEVDPLSEEGLAQAREIAMFASGISPAAGTGKVISRLAERRAAEAAAEAAPKPQLGVTLSEGQRTGAIPAIQREQAALRAQEGTSQYEHAQAFREQQGTQLEAAKDKLMKDLDQVGGQKIAATPQEAGELVTGHSADPVSGTPGSGMIGARDLAKTQVDTAYTKARALPGEIHGDALEVMPKQIRTDLIQRTEPVIVDESTPAAANMMKYIDSQFSRAPAQFEMRGLESAGAAKSPAMPAMNLENVDRTRRVLSSYRRSAATNEDRRAVQSVMDSFDNHIDTAINSGKFTGDPNAIQAWNSARAAHSDYRSTFTQQGAQDPVGKVVEKILGRGLEDPATPNDVISFITGASGLPAKGQTASVAKRIKEILGPDSPEWIGVKQGVFSKLVEKPEGVTDFGPGVVANRLGEFLNGKGSALANQLYAPPEKQLLNSYMELMRKLQVPQTGANWSNNVGAINQAAQKVIVWVGTAIGAAIGHKTGAGELIGGAIGYGAGKMAEGIGGLGQVKQLKKQMPLIGIEVKKWQRAVNSNPAIAPEATKVLETTVMQLLGPPPTPARYVRGGNVHKGRRKNEYQERRPRPQA